MWSDEIGWERLRAAGALALAALGAAGPAPARAQAVQDLDQGSYEIRLDGTRVGKETFVVRREGQVVKAVGRVSADSARPPVVPEEVWLQTDVRFQPQLFRLHPRSGDVENIVARRDGTRIRVQTSSEAGSRSQQFMAPPDISILEPGIAHEYFLFFSQHADRASGAQSWSVPVVIPSLGEQATVQVRRAGTDSVSVGGAPRPATRYELTLDGESILVWRDDRGRILQVHRPDRGWTAVRSDIGG
ncbi:MAG TPA: hypothetical protein VKB18_11735 [Gemmatimonadota bacterium]|nr:hypothetical protein [Gemmatimonadota bacterium]